MTENKAIKHLQSYAEVVDNMIKYCKDFEPKADITGYLEKKTVFAMAISALKEVQQYREIGTIEEIRKMINQGINNCYMSHKYEHPGYEEGMCAGLRTMNGDGEPVYKCKLCRLNYLFERSEGE